MSEASNPPAASGAAHGSAASVTTIYNFSGGMESAAMLYLCREQIQRDPNAWVVWANTGKQLPEMEESIAQIETVCGLTITRLQPSMTFDEFLFKRGGMLRQGYTDCSRRMKRKALREHANSLPRNQRIALGFNADEIERGQSFCERNDKPDRKFFFPLQELNIDRAASVKICEKAGFTILLAMYRKMGRFDCWFCPNQRISQAELVMKHYPAQWEEWKSIEKRKGHPILSISALAIEKRAHQNDFLGALEHKQQCSCMGGADVWDDQDDAMQPNS